MSEKRRGLGRGLGALIPQAPAGDRPIDVFFRDAEPVKPAIVRPAERSGSHVSFCSCVP